MNQSSRVFITSVGTVSPLGSDILSTYLAVQAKLSPFDNTAYYDQDGMPIRMATIPPALLDGALDESLFTQPIYPKHARMLALANLALKQIVPQASSDQPLPLFLACPESEKLKEPAVTHEFINLLSKHTGLPIHAGHSRIFHTGRSGTMDALDMAFKYLGTDGASTVIIGGVDTHFDLNTCNYYLSQNRLLTEAAFDGFIPGEAACFLLLSKQSPPQRNLPFVSPPGLGSEPGHMFSTEPYMGSGLADAVKRALSHHSGSKIGRIYSSMNGEHFFAKELGVMMSRNHEAFTPDVAIEHPADCYGDLGAAAGVVMIGLVYQEMFHKRQCSTNLVYCSADDAFRGATIVAC